MKMIFVLIDCLAVLDIYFITKASEHIVKSYGKWLRRTLLAGIIAIYANILIAFSFSMSFAHFAFCIYFASIDWVLYFLVGFCLSYTEHETALARMYKSAAVIMGLDSVSILLNPLFEHEFVVYFLTSSTADIFYQIRPLSLYYIHLTIDYIAVMIALVFITYRIIKSYGFYRTKYIMILSVLVLVVILNVAYMMFQLPLDASVIFYALAGTLIYFSIQTFVPQSLMMSSIGHTVDDMNEGLILFDISDNCIFANAFSKQRFSINPSSYDLSCEPVATVIRQLHEKEMKFGEESYRQTGGYDGNESDRQYLIKYNELNDKKGRMIGSYFLIEDNTEQEHYLTEIKSARDIADEANKAKSTFLANMSHEIRTPLNSVLGMNEMILRSTDDPQLLEYAQNIKISGDTLLELISDILDFSKIEANRMDIVCVEYNPHDLLRECLNSFEQPAEKKELYIRTDCDETIPSCFIGDAKLIRQILTNLVSNAVKYTKKGGIKIKVSYEDRVHDHATLIISVSDTGVGISQKDIEYMFDAFRRVNVSENATIQGTGLGLAITKELVTLMGGTISVDSTVNVGSTFTFRIPQQIADGRPLGKFVRFSGSKNNTYKESFTAPDAHILVVDDSSMNLKVVQALLRKTGIKIDTALGGNQAFEKCLKEKYDLILLDHRMPEPDGIQTFKMICENGLNTSTPVIMLTANVVSGAEEEYKSIGFADYLSKPIHGEDLEAALRKHLPDEKII